MNFGYVTENGVSSNKKILYMLQINPCHMSDFGGAGPKARTRVVADGQQVEIPVLRYDRTVGTRKESGSREWKARCKRGTSHFGKSGWQWEAVMRSEIK